MLNGIEPLNANKDLLMKTLNIIAAAACFLALNGCFGESDKSTTQKNGDGSKSSVQLQDKGADNK
jgi:hypothetical protein